MNPYAAKIYIDGSCYKNPGGPGGLAGVFVMPDDEEPTIIFQEGYKPTTNNRMELMALLKAMEYVKNNSSTFRSKNINEVEIFSDSDNSLTCYYCVERWRTENWKGVYGNPIKNVDLLKQLITLKNSVRFSYKPTWIQNKSTYETKMVDKLAKQAAQKTFLKNDSGYIKPKVSRTNVIGAAGPFDAQGQEIVIKVLEHVPVSTRKDSLYKIKFEIIKEDGNEKYYAYTSNGVNTSLHRWHYYNAQFNNEPKNPQIESVEEVSEAEFLAQCD